MNNHDIENDDAENEIKDIFDNPRYTSRGRLFSNSAKRDNFERDLGKIIQEEGLGRGNSKATAKWLIDDMDKQFGGITKFGPSGGVDPREMERYFKDLKKRNDGISSSYVEKFKKVFLRNHKNN